MAVRSASVGVVNPFPVDLDVRAEVNRQQDVPNTVTFYFLFLFTAGIIASGFYVSKKITSYRGKIATLLAALSLHTFIQRWVRYATEVEYTKFCIVSCCNIPLDRWQRELADWVFYTKTK